MLKTFVVGGLLFALFFFVGLYHAVGTNVDNGLARSWIEFAMFFGFVAIAAEVRSRYKACMSLLSNKRF